MFFRVSERKSTPPRTTEYQPAINVKMLTKLLYVIDQIPGGIFLDAGVRTTAPGTALIEQHDPIVFGIEESSLIGLGTAAGTAVNEEHRLTLRIAALLVIQLVDR